MPAPLARVVSGRLAAAAAADRGRLAGEISRELAFIRSWNAAMFALADTDLRRRGYGRTRSEWGRSRPRDAPTDEGG